MNNTRNITENIHLIGVDDRRTSLFENLFPLPTGVSYNSYFIDDKKIAILDTVDFHVSKQYMENIDYLLNGRQPDYLIVQHLEPDHSAAIDLIISKYPTIKLVMSKKAHAMLPNFLSTYDAVECIEVVEGQTLSLGVHCLQFICTPMVHWPEVIMTYEVHTKTLFSADAFGSFGAMNGNLYSEDINFEYEGLQQARIYYTNIVGKFGPQVQSVLKKASSLEIKQIAPLHGLLWKKEIPYIIDKYNMWSTYKPEGNDVCFIYGSIYGATESVVNIIANKLGQKGVQNIKAYDVSSNDISLLVSEMFRCKTIILACPTYNMGLFPKIEALLHDIAHLQLKNRNIGVIQNGSWSSCSAKLMKELLHPTMNILETEITINTNIKDDQEANLNEFVGEIYKSLKS